MTSRVINGILLLIAVAGLIAMLRSRSELRGIRAEHDQLADRFGTLDIEDPAKFYIRRINTDDPLHFAWRIYQPDELMIETRSRSLYGGHGMSRSSGPGGEGIVRVRFRFEEIGLRVFTKKRHGSSTSGLGNPALADFLKTHWDALEFEVIADEGTTEAGTDQVLTFLSVRLPDSLAAEAEEALGRALPNQNKNTIFEFHVGTPDAYEKEEATDGR